MLLFLFTSIIIPNVSSKSIEDELNVIKDKYENEKFSGTLKMEGRFSENVHEIKIIFFRGTQKQDESTKEITNGQWSYQADITTWPLGEYDVTLIAHDLNKTVIPGGELSFKIEIESEVESGIMQGEIFTKDFINKFKDKKFSDKLEMSRTLNDDVFSIQTKISKGGEVKVDETVSDLKNSWEFETSVEKWDEGEYNVILTAKAQNDTVLDTATFQIKVEEEEPFYMPLVCAILLIIFIVLIIIFFILSILKHKKIMTGLKFNPKNVVKKLPMISYMSMFITLLLVLSGLAVCITAGLDIIPFILFLVVLGFLMLITYWVFSNRNLPPFLLYLILNILSLIVISLAAVWSETDASGLIVGSGLILAALIIYFISILFYWLGSRRGIFIALVTVILTLVFMILQIVFIVLAVIFIIPWSIPVILGCVLMVVSLLLTWIILREDLFYFETREESKTHRGSRMTFNMFDILSTARGLFKRDYDRKVMGKISYEKTHDKKVRMEVISLRAWDTVPGRSQGKRLMGVYVGKMRSKEGPPFNKEPVAEAVKYTIYSSDVNLDDKLKLCRSFGFEVVDSGKERGLEFFDLELVHKPFLGLGAPAMGPVKKKIDYDKESGYKKDSKKDAEADRDHQYDYEHDDKRRREEEERKRDADYERDRERDRRRSREREPDEDLEDWGSSDRSRDDDGYYGSGYEDDDRTRDRRRARGREREATRPPPKREPPAEKPKKRPPPPRIVKDS